MKIFLVSRGYPKDQYKMNGIFERDFAEALAERGVEVVFLAVDMRSIRRKRKLGYTYFEKNGVKVYGLDLPVGAVSHRLFNKINFWALDRLYKKVVKKEGKPDLIHTFFTDQAYSCALLKEKYGFKLVVTEPNSKINVDVIEEELRKMAEFAYKKADVLITVSPDFQKKIKKKFGIDSKLVTIIPDMRIFEYGKDKTENFRIVSTGGLVKLKGMKELIEAFNSAFDDDKKVLLTIFGRGPEREALEEMVKEYGLQDRVSFRGLVSREELASEYKKSNLFCLYSHMETFGLAYLEALAAGLPIIVPTCGGPEHLVEESNGLLIELFDKEALVKALKYMRENISSYDGAMISKRAKEEYSRDNIISDLKKVYEEVING